MSYSCHIQTLYAQKSSDDFEATTTRNDRERGILVLLTVPFAWGTFEPVVRSVYAIDPPIPGLIFSPCYYFVAASALSLLSFATALSEQDKNDHQDNQDNVSWLTASLPVLGGIELGFYLFFGNSLQVLGLKTLNSDRVAFLIQLTTIFVPLVQGLAAGNLFAIPKRTWIACIIAFCGAGVIGLDGSETALQDIVITQDINMGVSSIVSPQKLLSQGDYLVVGSALAYTFHCIRLERYAKETRAVTLAACKATTETILSLLLVLALLSYNSDADGSNATSNNFLNSFATESATEISLFLNTFPQKLADGSIPNSVLLPAFAAVLWTGLVTCGYTIYAQSYGQSRVNSSTANLIYTFQPVWTSLIAYFFLGETLGPSGFLGGAMIGLAVYLVISLEQQPEPEQ